MEETQPLFHFYLSLIISLPPATAELPLWLKKPSDGEMGDKDMKTDYQDLVQRRYAKIYSQDILLVTGNHAAYHEIFYLYNSHSHHIFNDFKTNKLCSVFSLILDTCEVQSAVLSKLRDLVVSSISQVKLCMALRWVELTSTYILTILIFALQGT